MRKHDKRPPARILVACNASYGPSPRQTVDVAVPVDDRDAAERPLLALIAGGWWHGERESLRSCALLLAEMGHATTCIGHRLFDEAPNGIPMRKDIEEGCQRALEETDLLGCPCRSVVLIGSGSGCHSALLAAWSLNHSGLLPVAGTVLIGAPPPCPWPDCPDRWAGMLNRFFADHPELDLLAQAGAHQPPTLTFLAHDDEALPLTTTQSWCDDLRSRGCLIERLEYRRVDHDLLAAPVSHDTLEVLEHLERWTQDITKPRHGLPVIGEAYYAPSSSSPSD